MHGGTHTLNQRSFMGGKIVVANKLRIREFLNKLQTCEFHAGTDLEGPQKGLVENDGTHN